MNRAGMGMLLMLGIITARPAAAQVTFGSPGDPPRVALGGGAFDVLPDYKKPHATARGLGGERIPVWRRMVDFLALRRRDGDRPGRLLRLFRVWLRHQFSLQLGLDAQLSRRVISTVARDSTSGIGGSSAPAPNSTTASPTRDASALAFITSRTPASARKTPAKKWPTSSLPCRCNDRRGARSHRAIGALSDAGRPCDLIEPSRHYARVRAGAGGGRVRVRSRRSPGRA